MGALTVFRFTGLGGTLGYTRFTGNGVDKSHGPAGSLRQGLFLCDMLLWMMVGTAQKKRSIAVTDWKVLFGGSLDETYQLRILVLFLGGGFFFQTS